MGIDDRRADFRRIGRARKPELVLSMDDSPIERNRGGSHSGKVNEAMFSRWIRARPWTLPIIVVFTACGGFLDPSAEVDGLSFSGQARTTWSCSI